MIIIKTRQKNIHRICVYVFSQLLHICRLTKRQNIRLLKCLSVRRITSYKFTSWFLRLSCMTTQRYQLRLLKGKCLTDKWWVTGLHFKWLNLIMHLVFDQKLNLTIFLFVFIHLFCYFVIKLNFELIWEQFGNDIFNLIWLKI